MAKAFYFEKTVNDIGILWFDYEGEKVNKFNTEVMLELSEQLTWLSAQRDLKCLLIMSRKPGIFVAGADVHEILVIEDQEAGYRAAREGQGIFARIEKLPFPTVSVIDGACMGGGLEMSLACAYRLSSDSPKTKISFPEVNIGILPGWGGSTRTPSVIGLQRALDIILSGRSLAPKQALRMGLVDKIIAAEWIREKAIAFALEIIASGGVKYQRRRKPKGVLSLLLEKNPLGRAVLFHQAKKMILKKTAGNYPAPLIALQTLRKTYGKPQHKAFEVEARALGRLITTDTCKNLVRLFLWMEEIKKENGLDDAAISGQTVQKCGILGAGVMGGGMAQLFAAKEIPVRLKDIQHTMLAKAYQQAADVLNARIRKRRLTKPEALQIMGRISGGIDYSGFRTCDIVIEAVVENLPIKKTVLTELEAMVPETTVIATNTSSLRVDDLSEALQHKSRFVGMHFFNPVHRMPLVEIVRGRSTSDEAVATAFNLAKRLGKTPILVHDGPGFLVNRLLTPYLVEAISLLEEGHDIETIDRAMIHFGMPMGPLELLDEVGVDVADKVAHILQTFMGERMATSQLLQRMLEAGRLGKKSGKGFYRYAGRKKSNDPAVRQLISARQKTVIDAETMVKRMVYPMINEAARCLDEGIVQRPRDVDIGMIFGTGFAPFRGGLLKYADSEGLDKVIKLLEEFTGRYGERFKPGESLKRYIPSEFRTFYSS
jgi:3-hydroxyacyl-CoA dehydrogenase/enoyl-CoA hydratase/3-hydroxybutyryl-CoA epimerase